MKAMPVSAGMPEKNASNASTPPADAPTPAIRGRTFVDMPRSPPLFAPTSGERSYAI
jgi:hypothetical protein